MKNFSNRHWKVVCVFCTTFLFSVFFASKAQAQANSTGTATLNVRIVDVLLLTVNTTVVNLNFTDAASYQTGVSATLPAQLTVTSNRAFTLKVRAGGTNLTSSESGNTDVIPVNKISVSVANAAAIGGTANTVALSSTDQNLIASAPAGIAKSFNMLYSTAANDSDFAKAAGTYTTTLTYTATVP